MKEKLCRWLYRHRCKGLACLVAPTTYGALLGEECRKGFEEVAGDGTIH